MTKQGVMAAGKVAPPGVRTVRTPKEAAVAIRRAAKKDLIELETDRDKCRVLVFDENATDLARHSGSFEAKGFPVHRCTSVEKALRYMERRKVAFALIDLGSPAHEGLRLFQHLARYSPHAASVVITRFDDTEARREAFTMGALECLEKPVSGADLDWVILKYLALGAEAIADRR